MGGERDQGETEVGERQGETELGRWETETKRERDKRGHTHREKQTGKTEAERVLASGRDGDGEGEGVSAAETEGSLGSGGVRAIREGHSGLGSPAGAGPAGYRRGPSLPPPIPTTAAAAAAEFRVTKLPQDSEASHWRGRSQSESSVAVLGQEAWRCTFPRHPAKHAATQSQWLTHLPCPRDTQHRLPPIRTQSQRHTSCHTHAAPGTRRDTQHRRRTKSQGHTRSSRTHSTAQIHNHNDTQHYPNTQHTETQCCPDPCILHDLDPRAHNISGTHNARGHGTHIIAVIHTITMTHSITVTQDCTDTQPY